MTPHFGWLALALADASVYCAANAPLLGRLPVHPRAQQHWSSPPGQLGQTPSYSPGQGSSLVVAFENPDGTLLSSLLSPHRLFLFGSAAELRRWKQKPPLPQNPRNSDPDNPKVGAGSQLPSTSPRPPGVADPTTPKPRHKCQCTSQLVPMPVNPMDTAP